MSSSVHVDNKRKDILILAKRSNTMVRTYTESRKNIFNKCYCDKKKNLFKLPLQWSK